MASGMWENGQVGSRRLQESSHKIWPLRWNLSDIAQMAGDELKSSNSCLAAKNAAVKRQFRQDPGVLVELGSVPTRTICLPSLINRRSPQLSS